MDHNRLRDELRARLNYIIIGFTSFLAIGVIPFLTTAFDDASDEEIIKEAFPDSTIGWIVWAIFRLMIVIINMSILIAFVNQGRLNVQDNPDYKAAIDMWLQIQVYNGKHHKKHKRALYLTPKQHYAQLYSRKGLSLAIGSFASCFTITLMILNWDLATFIVIVITVAFAIVFGFLQMEHEEFYWTNDFKVRAEIEYKKMEEEKEEEKKCL